MMKKTSMLKIGEGYSYSLKDNKDLVVKSIGSYNRHFNVKEEQKSDSQGEHVEEIDEKPNDLKPLVQETEVKGSGEDSRSELYEEIQELNDLANLSLKTSSVSDKLTPQNSADPMKR